MVAHSDSESPIPQDTEAEQALLGAVLLVPDHLEEVRGALTLEDFWSPAHREIFRAMLAASDAGGAVDLVTVSGRLEDAGQLEAVGGWAAVSKLIGGAIRLSNVAAYATRIKDKSNRRALMRLGVELADKWAHDPGDVEDVMAAASGALELIRAGDGGGLEDSPVQDCGSEPEPVPLIRRAGDRFGSVLAVGEVCILTGPGKVGKSTLVRQIASAAADAASMAECAGAGSLDVWQEDVAGLDVRGGPAFLVTYEDSKRRTHDACRLLCDPIPPGLRVLQARGHPLFGVREGEPMTNRPQRLPAWFRVWAQIRKAKARLVVIDPLGSAFLGNSASVEAARAFIDALMDEAERAECGLLLVAHSTKDARKDGKADDPGQVAGSAAFSDAARAVMVLAHDRLSLELGNYCRPFQVDLEPITEGGRFAGFREAKPSCRTDAPGNTGITENDL